MVMRGFGSADETAKPDEHWLLPFPVTGGAMPRPVRAKHVTGPCKDPYTPEACPGDFDGDGDVDVFDMLELIFNFGPCP